MPGEMLKDWLIRVAEVFFEVVSKISDSEIFSG